MDIRIFPNGIYGATTYLVFDEKSKEAVLIDATNAVSEIEEIVNEKKLDIKYILITHGHFDHVYALPEFKKVFPNAMILIHKDDVELIDNIAMQCEMAGLENVTLPCVDGLVSEESRNLKVGEVEIKIIHTKGHSKGGVSYLIGDMLFTGDTLFRASIGRSDLWGGDIKELEFSIRKKLYKLDDSIKVYPGHGDMTTIGYERKYNVYFPD